MSKFTNRLAQEKSPYLLQHAHNPVDWFPWGEEAFAKARTENKPIFLSVGYSTCHWCHVMEHESFESTAIAKLLNDHFVSIKVDREERPDVDHVYMTFVQATTGHGGWPMSVWLTPELKPFLGGTYFGAVDYPNRPSFKTILEQIHQAWVQQRVKVEEKAHSLATALREAEEQVDSDLTPVRASILRAQTLSYYARAFDPEFGGFGPAPKFPRPVNLEALLNIAALKSTDTQSSEAARSLVFHTLRKMAQGGMYDHLGGGFHRYSVDAQWHVPHFEKMLYDQAQLVPCYLAAYQLSGEAFFAEVAQDTLRYVTDDLMHEDTENPGGFYSAEDADSLPVLDAPKKKEGSFYVWTHEKVVETLGEERAKEFCTIYDIRSEGNVDPHFDPHADLAGQNVLIQRISPEFIAQQLKRDYADLKKSLMEDRALLLARRGLRPRPHLDDKILTAWNGLMIGAYARGYLVLHDASYLHRATSAAEFIQANLYDARTKELQRSYREGASGIAGYANDYACLIHGLLDLYQATTDLHWLRWADELQETMDRLFWDEKHGGGYFSTTDRDPSILIRMKEDYDGAEPAPNSVAANNLWRLAQLLNQPRRLEQAGKTVAAFGTRLEKQPFSMPLLMVAASRLDSPPLHVIVHSPNGAHPDLAAFLRVIHARYLPQLTVIVMSTPEDYEYFAPKHPEVAHMAKDVSVPTAYVCENMSCQLPVTTAEALKALLEKY